MKWIYAIFIFLSVFLISSLTLFQENSSILFGSKDEIYKMSVYLKKNLTADEISKFQSTLKNTFASDIDKMKLVSVLDQMKDFQSSASFNAEGLFTEEDLIQVLSPLIELVINPDADESKLTSQIKQNSLVEEVVYGAEWGHKFKEIRNLTSIALLISLGIFGFVTFLLLMLILRLYLIEDKPKISIWAIVGATPKFIFTKYSKLILTTTFVSAFLAYASVFGAYLFLKMRIAQHSYFGFMASRIHFISALSAVGITACLLIALSLALYLFHRTLIKLYYTYE